MVGLPVTKKAQGWMSVVPHGTRIDLAHVIREVASRPEVQMLESFAVHGDEAEALQRLRTTYKLKQANVTTLLGTGDYRLVQLEAPEVPEQERREALRWRLKDMVDFPVDQASVDVLDIPGGTAPGGRSAGVLVAAASAEVVAKRMGAFDKARVPLQVIDLPELAQRNVAALFEEPNRGLAFLSIADDGGLLTFTHHGELYAFRRIDVTASQLADADGERRQQILERVALELQRSLDTFDRQFSYVSIARLMVACSAAVDELQPVLAANLYLPVQMMDLTTVMDCAAIPELRNIQRQAQCLGVLGAALRSAA